MLASITMVLLVVGALGVLLTPGLLIAGIMGLAREGPRGRFFFVEQAFYWSTMLFPLLFLASSIGTVIMLDRNPKLLGVACFIVAVPFLLPAALWFAAMMLPS